jgi:UDPglucose--hexose-1-phosphate uridylyltransferase
MAEIRQNLATREWVIIADERARRPEEFIAPDNPRTDAVAAHDADCPFCPGQEVASELVARWPAEGPWQGRIVRNKYPALQWDGGPRRHSFDGVRRRLSGVGHHEVLVETPVHNQWPALQSPEQTAAVLRAFRDRGRALRADARIEQLVFFKNHGASAGTSLVHPHAQLIALPMVSRAQRTRIEEARRHFDDTGACVFCRMLQEELAAGERIVCESPHFVSFVPYAAYSPFHLWVMPRKHASDFLEISDAELLDLGWVLRRALRRIHFGLNDPDFNYVLHTAPMNESRPQCLHWYMAIVPRVSKLAGFELGSGMHINSALPEESARFLRGVHDPEQYEQCFGPLDSVELPG